MAELKTFLFTDICRSVDLKNEMAGRSVTERDQAFIETILTPHRERIGTDLETYGGRVVSTAGDGHFLVFDNTVRAAQWAVAVQRDHRDHPILTPGDGRVEVRISIHVGVPQIDPADPNNFVGKSVDYASRLNDYAQGAQILVSRSVMAILHDVGLEGIAFHLQGRRELKGIGHVEVHELLYDANAPVPLRQRPQTQSDREWTVLPTEGFDPGARPASLIDDTAVLTAPTLKRIGNYQLEQRLGAGGMGDVYLGRHSQFGRVRAIKVIKPQYVAAGNTDVIQRFYREIKAVGALEHKNIVVAIDSSAPTDRLHYLVMEYLDGVALDDLVQQQGSLGVADACEIARQAARGLDYIHRHGMVHRDIKPSNLMLTLMDAEGLTTDSTHISRDTAAQGVVKILDLGLALLSDDQHDRLTRYDNKAMGTGMYMSPEQWKTTSVDIRADIYSLGCTLYHLLAGQPPFLHSDLRPEKAHEKSRVPPIRGRAAIPRPLWELLRQMLAKRPADRLANPAEVAAALEPFTEGHNLAALVASYRQGDPSDSSLRPTHTDSGARIETWLSRASHIYPGRRWLWSRGLPLLLAVGVVAGLFWSLQQNSSQKIQQLRRREQQMIAETMQRERLNLLKFAEEVAHDFIGAEITKRFRILVAAARDPALPRMIAAFAADEVRAAGAAYPLTRWIENQRTRNIDVADSNSWFLNNAAGLQIARHPFRDEQGQIVATFMKDFSFRDYFHGEEKDRDPQATAGVQPITAPHISSVYKSRNSGKLKVAFSVPVWSQQSTSPAGQPAAPRRLLGVLSTSFNLGEFEVSGLSYSTGKQVILVDMRRDYLTGAPQQGLIINHEHQSIWKAPHPPRVDAQVLAAMQAAEENFVAGYHDPLSLRPETTYWGAFKRVPYEIPDPQTDQPLSVSSSFVVLVQTAAMQPAPVPSAE